MIKTVIFDLGGTLIEYASEFDTWPELEEPGLNAAHAVLSESGLKMPRPKRFRTTAFEILPRRWAQATAGERNLTVADFLTEVLSTLGAEMPDKRTLSVATEHYEAAICAGAEVMPYSQETVHRISAEGYRLGLISNTMFSGQAHLKDLERFGLSQYFESLLFSADVNKWKPNRAAFTHVMAELRAAPETTVFVGDDPGADVAGARRAGMHVIHYHSSDRFPASNSATPDATIDDLRQLGSVLVYLNGNGPG